MNALRRTMLLAGFSIVASQAIAAEAYITSCSDGDTCTAMAAGQQFKVRLHGADSPESDQPAGAEATALMRSLVVGKVVDVEDTGQRSYGRVVADMRLSDGRDVASIMVGRGYAWVERRYNTDPTAWDRQAAAQQAHAGLWANPAAIPPWEWRAVHGTFYTHYQPYAAHPYAYHYSYGMPSFGWRSR